jgi:hypothetical protein
MLRQPVPERDDLSLIFVRLFVRHPLISPLFSRLLAGSSPAGRARICLKDAGMSPICNLRFKDIPINCERSVMRALESTFCPVNVTEFSVAAFRFGAKLKVIL